MEEWCCLRLRSVNDYTLLTEWEQVLLVMEQGEGNSITKWYSLYQTNNP